MLNLECSSIKHLLENFRYLSMYGKIALYRAAVGILQNLNMFYCRLLCGRRPRARTRPNYEYLILFTFRIYSTGCHIIFARSSVLTQMNWSGKNYRTPCRSRKAERSNLAKFTIPLRCIIYKVIQLFQH